VGHGRAAAAEFPPLEPEFAPSAPQPEASPPEVRVATPKATLRRRRRIPRIGLRVWLAAAILQQFAKAFDQMGSQALPCRRGSYDVIAANDSDAGPASPSRHGNAPNSPWSTGPLARQAAGAVLWAVFFAVAPIDILLPGVLVWLPFLVWRERVRSRKYGFTVGALLRLSVVAGLLYAAYRAPVKHMDIKVGPVHYDDMTVHDLCSQLQRDHGIPCIAWDEQDYVNRASFSTSEPMSRLDVLTELARVTDHTISRGGCANGSTILFGLGSPGYYLHPRKSHSSTIVETGH
jgi:hypothetical protein